MISVYLGVGLGKLGRLFLLNLNLRRSLEAGLSPRWGPCTVETISYDQKQARSLEKIRMALRA